MKESKHSGTNADAEAKNPEEKITSLLHLRAKLEQEVRADTRKLDDLKKDIELKLGWMHHLDEILSEASFQPASELVGEIMAVTGEREPDSVPGPGPEPEPASGSGSTAVKEVVIDLKSFAEPVNIKNPKDNSIYATLNFMQGSIMIMINQKLRLVPESRVFQDFFQRNIVSVFEKEGGKIFLERDESGILRMITISGSFKTELKEQLIRRLAQVVVQFREASRDAS
ncbi:MAG: hypothetical protein GYA24_07100 [Candidatus Lokiarchaeota archaeon]|nr:hypothetical protein [Candidatus Lokiarchaeota archaeon]